MEITPAQKIKERINCVDVAKQAGMILRPDGEKFRTKSFRSEATNPTSLLISEDTWCDFGTGDTGDAIALYARINNMNDGHAISELAKIHQIDCGYQNYDIIFNKQQLLIHDVTQYWSQQRTKEIDQYLEERGINEETAKKCQIGYSTNPCKYLKEKGYTQEEINESQVNGLVGRIIIPYIKKGKPVYLIGRKLPSSKNEHEPKYKKLKRTAFNEHAIWNIDDASRHKDVWIAEGAVDGLSCVAAGQGVISPITGRFTNAQRKLLLFVLKGKKVTICLDYDPESKTGQKATRELAQYLYNGGIDVDVVMLNGGKEKQDLNDTFVQFGGLDYARSLAKPYEMFFFQNLNRQAGSSSRAAEKVARSMYKRKHPADVEGLLDQLMKSDKYANEKQWLKSVFSTAKKPPTEKEVVIEMMETENYVFNAKTDWAVFDENTGLWSHIVEELVRKEISKIMGNSATGSKVKSIQTLAQADMYKEIELDTNTNYIAFANGKLIDGALGIVPFQRKDMISITTGYDHNPRAKCPNTIEWLEEIFNGDEEKIKLYLQWVGYCMSTDTQMCQAMLLLGSGANGKSMAVNLARDIVGAGNVSFIPMKKFADKFALINLLGKRLNVSTENETSQKDIEQTLKTLIACEEIACRNLYKSEVTFKPIAKHMFSFNEMPEFVDTTKGWLRRWLILDFNLEFTDDTIIHKNQRKKVVGLYEDKIKPELAGIANVAMEHYQEVKENRQFTIPASSVKRVQQMREKSDPIAQFVKEVPKPGNYTVEWLFNSFNQFIEQKNMKDAKISYFQFENKLVNDHNMYKKGGHYEFPI